MTGMSLRRVIEGGIREMRLRERKKSQEREKCIRESLDREFHKSRVVLMGLKALRWEMERLAGQSQEGR